MPNYDHLSQEDAETLRTCEAKYTTINLQPDEYRGVLHALMILHPHDKRSRKVATLLRTALLKECSRITAGVDVA